MAKLADFNNANINTHSDGKQLAKVISCMQEMLKLPNYETSQMDTSCEIIYSEKSFWGKTKLKAYCEVCIIEDLELNVEVQAGEVELPQYLNVALGFTFWTDNFFDGYIRQIVGEDRKIILSYYWLLSYIDTWVTNIKGMQIGANEAFQSNQMALGLDNMLMLTRIYRIQGIIKALDYQVAING